MCPAMDRPRVFCPNIIFRPGIILNGHVEVPTSEKELSQVTVEVALVGVALTSLRAKRSIGTEYDGTARLLCAHARLKSTEDGRFPFSFTFPDEVHDLPHDRVIFSNWGLQQPFNSAQTRHLLPPSLDLARDQYNAHVTALIRYELIAKVASPYHDSSTMKKSLRFSWKTVPPQDISRKVATKTSHFSARGWELLPESLRPRGLSKLTAVVAPKLEVDSFILFPLHIYLGRSIEVHIQITPKTSDDLVTRNPPEIVLHSFTVTIQAKTYARSNKRFGDHKSEMCSTLIFEHSLHKDNSETAHRPDPEPFSAENEHTKKLLMGPISEEQAVPSFSTFNVARSYRAKIRIALSVGMEVFTHDQDLRVTIHPPLADTNGTVAEEMDPQLGTGEQLPSYEFAVAQESSDDTKGYTGPGFNELRPVNISPAAISTNEHFLPQEAMESFFTFAGIEGVPAPGPFIQGPPARYGYGPARPGPSIRVPGGVDGQGAPGSRYIRDAEDDKPVVSEGKS